MAPPEHLFPVSELDQRIHTYTENLKEKNRKLGDFDLKRDCELYELVQYSCTTPEQMYKQRLESPTGTAQMECTPFVRLFRKCQKGNHMFHVETTAWEGEHAWKPTKASQSTEANISVSQPEKTSQSYWNYFWSSK